jgi:hypothetical protein
MSNSAMGWFWNEMPVGEDSIKMLSR